MRVHVCFVTFILLAQSIHIKADSQLVLTVLPKTIEAHLTKSLLVNCSYNDNGNGYMVVSLIIKKENDLVNGSLAELAYINSYTHGLVQSVGNLNATCKGQIDHIYGSYISIEWDYPSPSESGNYVCEGNLMNGFGEVHLASVQSTVGMEPLQLSEIVRRIQEIETNLQDMKSRILNSIVLQATMQQDISTLLSVKNDWKSALFSISSLYADSHESRYYLSRFQPQDATNAEEACTTLGGYLAEVDTLQEYNFIVSFVRESLKSGIHILLGGTDEPYGIWVNRQNGTQLGYTNWNPYHYSSEANSTHQCQSVSAQYFGSVYMEQIPCYNSPDYSTYFLCEVHNV